MEDIYRGLQSGAKSYLLKDMSTAEIIGTIRSVHEGTVDLPTIVTERLSQRLQRQALTNREREVLLFLVKGRSNREIAAALGISEETAEPSPSAVVTLSPFVVETTQDIGYLATSTLAGTRLNTSLKDVGAAVSVFTEEFLADIGVQNIEDILAYTASTEGGGVNGNFSGITGDRQMRRVTTRPG